MIKLLTFLKRREPMTPAELKTRWLTIHAPIALEFPGLRGYMLSFPVVTEPEPTADAVAQLWFDSREACQESYATDIGRNGSADANAYLSRRQHMLASEDWLACERSLEGLPFKYQVGVKRADGESRENFVTWWRGPFAEAAVRHGANGVARLAYDEAGLLLNSGTTGALTLMSAEAPFDGMFETWYPTREALLEAAASSPIPRLCAGRVSAMEIYALEEHVMRLPPSTAYGRPSGG